MSELQAQIEQFKSRIYQLPQAAVLKETDVDRWLSGMVARINAIAGAAPAEHKGQSPMSDIGWHIERAGGMGGSEAGTAYLHQQKERWMDVSLPRLVDQKLFRALPEPTNEHMERGSYLEPVAQRMFQTRWNAVTDQAAMDRIANFGGWSAYPWMRGFPDDIVAIGGKRYLVDYKMPETPMSEVPVMYSAQVHHYWALAQLSGIKLDGLLVAGATLPGAQAWVEAIKNDPEALNAALDMGEWIAKSRSEAAPINTQRVNFSGQFAKTLIKLNDAVWQQNVMTGTRPRYFQKETVELTEAEMEKGAAISERFVRHKAIAEYAEGQMTIDRAELEALMSNKQIKGKKQPFAAVSIIQRENIDTDAAAQALVGQGIDTDSLRKEATFDVQKLVTAVDDGDTDMTQFQAPGTWDKKKVKKALEDSDLVLDEFSTPSFSAGFTRAKKGLGHMAVSNAKSMAEIQVNAIVERDLATQDGTEPNETTPHVEVITAPHGEKQDTDSHTSKSVEAKNGEAPPENQPVSQAQHAPGL